MIDVRQGKSKRKRPRDRHKDCGKCDGVGTAAARDDDAVAVLQDAVAAHVLFDRPLRPRTPHLLSS